MTSPSDPCLSFGELADYWTVDASTADVERIDAHVFGCTDCARLLAEAELLRRLIGTTAQAGGFLAFVTDALLNQLSRDGVRVRSYALGPGDSVQCAAWDDDDVIVARIRADLEGVTAVDAIVALDSGQEWTRTSDVPVREGATELLMAFPGDAIRNAPPVPIRLTLRDSSGGRLLGEYTFDHQGAHTRT